VGSEAGTWIEFLGHESLAVFHPTLAAEVLP
jgi:hypothetical protein